MQQDQVFATGPGGQDDPQTPAAGAKQPQVDALDDILDEIDAVLETDARTFVQDFVQKGGQ